MAQPVSQEKRIEFFEAYCERQTVQHVAITCSASLDATTWYKKGNCWKKQFSNRPRRTDTI